MCRNRRNVDNRPTVRLLSAVDELFLICIMYGSYVSTVYSTYEARGYILYEGWSDQTDRKERFKTA